MADTVSQPGGSGTGSDGAKLQSDDRTKPGFEPTDDEKKVVQGWLQRVTRAEEKTETKEWLDKLADLRGYVAGTKHSDKTKDKLVRTNMVFATIAAQIPELYARNPQIAVTPTDAVPEAELGKVKKFCATAERVIRKVLVEEGKLKKRMKANIRSVSTTSYGTLKVLYQHEYRGDPIAVRRMQDTQDNLAKVEALIRDLKKADDAGELAKKRDELRANLTALRTGNEVRIYKGFTVDRLKSEDFLVLDDNVSEFDEYVDAAALGHRIWMRVGAAKVLFDGVDLTSATKYGQPRLADSSTKTPENTQPDDMFICVVEMWDRENGVIRTTAKGMNRWLRDPYAPEHPPERWYPFYVLAYNPIEGRWRPISDVELLMGLQDEYNTTRTNYADVREKAVPVTIVRKAGNLTEEDVEKIVNRGNKDTIVVEGNPTVSINQDVMRLEGPKIDPQAYDVSMIRNDMDLVSGRSDASRANLIKPKTATEAEIMQESMQSRMGERRDTNEDLMSEMGESALQTSLMCFTKEEVKQIAGAEAEWPDSPQSAETVFRMVQVRVRAGSSGKPNASQERDQWKELLPVLSDAIGKVLELRAAGNYELADATLELIRETLRRYDEHLDLDAIIPPMEKDENGKPVAAQQAGMQLAQTTEQLQACQEELGKTKEDLAKAQTGEQAKLAEIQSKEKLAEDAADAKVSFERWKATLDAATDIIQTEISTAMTANAKDPEAQQAAVEKALSDERMATILKDLKVTMDKLGSAFERVQPQQGAGG